MKVTKFLTLLAVVAGGVLLVRRLVQSALASDSSAPAPSPYVPVVQDALKQYQGEESLMVRAFEEALEEDRRYEEQLAQDVGVHA